VVGREDVASLAVAAALFEDTHSRNTTTNNSTKPTTPFHMVLGVRWCGALDPPFGHNQGKQCDGHSTSQESLLQVLKKKKENNNVDMLSSFRKPSLRRWWHRRKQLKPYAIFVALPLCLAWVWVLNSCFRMVGVNLRQVILQILIPNLRHGITKKFPSRFH